MCSGCPGRCSPTGCCPPRRPSWSGTCPSTWWTGSSPSSPCRGGEPEAWCWEVGRAWGIRLANHAGPVVRGRGRRGHGVRPGHTRTRPGPRRRAAGHPAAGVRADRAAVPVPAVLYPQAGPAPDPGRPAHHGDRSGGERVTAAHRRAAGRGHHPVHARQQAKVRAGRDRARWPPGAQLPDPFGQPGQVHHRAAPGPGRGLVRPRGDQPVVQHHQHAGGHAEDLPAAAGHRAEQLARRGRRRDADDLGHRRGRRGAAAVPGRGRPAPGALEVDGPVRRADGAPRGTPVAQQRVGVPRHPARGARGDRARLDVRVRGQRGRLDRRAPVRRGLPGQAHHRGRRDRPARHLPGHPARHARGHHPVAGRRLPDRHVRAGQRGRSADRCDRPTVRGRRQPAGREQARQRPRHGAGARRLRVGIRRDRRGHGADGGDPVGRGLAGRGGQREHAARRRLAAAAPTRRPAVAGRRPGRGPAMTQSGRMTVTTAVACMLASTVLLPLFINTLWFVIAAGAVIAVAATGALTRLRTLPVPACLAATVAGLVLYLNLIFEVRHSLLLVIPTPGSLTRLWDLFGTGVHDANRYAPPAPNLPGLLLLAAGGVGITAVLADLIAVRLRSTALAGLPLLVLFTVPVTMNASHDQFSTSVVFCLGGAGYLAMLSADGRERIRVWGRLVSLWRSAPRHGGTADGGTFDGAFDGDGRSGASRQVRGRRPGPDTRTLAAAGRRVGLASIVLALCAPLIVPGLHPSRLFSSGPGIGGRGGVGGSSLSLPSALSQTVTQLHESQPSTVFTYSTNASASQQANDAEYFRQYVFDTLGAGGWQVDDYSARAVQVSRIPSPQGLVDTT